MSRHENSGLTFGKQAGTYATFRFSYPPGLFGRIFEDLEADQFGAAVDLGSGTGLSTLAPTGRFQKVFAVEPDQDMAAQIPERTNLEVIPSTSEQADFEKGSVDLVTCGTAFYWMDAGIILPKVARWLKPKGLLAVFRYALPTVPAEIQVILNREFNDHWNQFRDPRLLDEGSSWRAIRESPYFREQEKAVFPTNLTMTAEEFAGFWSSTSYGSAYLRSIPDPGKYLEGLMEELSVTGKEAIEINFPAELILAHPK